MSTKELLVKNIQELVQINKKMTEIQRVQRELRDKKKKLSEELINIMEGNNIDGFDIANGKVMHKKTKVKGTINKNFLLNMLENYFKNNPEIDTEDVTNFILDNRPIKETSSIAIKENKT